MQSRRLSWVLFGLAALALVLASAPAFAGGKTVQRLLAKGRYGAAAKHWAKTIARDTAGGAGNFTVGSRVLSYEMTAARANKATLVARDGKRRYAPRRYTQDNPRSGYLVARGRELPYGLYELSESLIGTMLDEQAGSGAYRIGSKRLSARVTKSTPAAISIVTRTESGREYQRDFVANGFAGQDLTQVGPAKRIK